MVVRPGGGCVVGAAVVAVAGGGVVVTTGATVEGFQKGSSSGGPRDVPSWLTSPRSFAFFSSSYPCNVFSTEQGRSFEHWILLQNVMTSRNYQGFPVTP